MFTKDYKMPANFITVTSSARLEELIEQSFVRPIVFFKHSITCGISRGVYQIVNAVDADINLIVVQNSRDLSNQIAHATGIRHESPQAIVIKDGVAVYSASHYDIEPADIESAIGVDVEV